MNKIFYLIFAIAITYTSVTAKAQNACVIKGTITDVKDGTAKLYTMTNILLDSVSMVNGKFELKSKLNTPQYGFIYVTDKQDNNVKILRIFLESREIGVNGASGVDKKTEITNAPLHDEAMEYANYISSLDASKKAGAISVLVSNAFKAGDKIKVNELEEKRFVFYREILDKIFEFKKDAKKSHIAAYFAQDYATRLPLDDQIKTAARFSPELTDSYYLNSLKENITAEKRVILGNNAPDFKAKDLSGKEYTKASFAGKYIFLEFSASWCGWCKKEIPYIRDAYHALKDKNIVFITMNMDDKREKWEGDVTKENIEWLCISNLQGIKSDLAKSYNVHGIPACFVIDPDGKIIKRDIRGNEVLEYLSSLVK